MIAFARLFFDEIRARPEKIRHDLNDQQGCTALFEPIRRQYVELTFPLGRKSVKSAPAGWHVGQ